MVESPKDCKPPRDFGKTLKKAHVAMAELDDPDTFYTPKWYALVEKYPDVAYQIESVRVHAASVGELNALQKLVEEQGLIIQKLWEHRVRGRALPECYNLECERHHEGKCHYYRNARKCPQRVRGKPKK